MTQPADLDRIVGRCLACGYDLRGNTTGRCPECGRVSAEVAAEPPGTPWANPRGRRIREFVSTVFIACLNPGEIARDIVRPVDPDAGRRFRWIVIWLAWLGTALCLAPAWWSSELRGMTDDGAFHLRLRLFQIVFLAAALAGLAVAAASADLCLRDGRLTPEHDRRVRRLAVYACAPLALLSAGALSGPIVSMADGTRIEVAFVTCLFAVIPVAPTAWWSQYRFQRTLLLRPPLRAAVLATVGTIIPVALGAVAVIAVLMLGGFLLFLSDPGMD